MCLSSRHGRPAPQTLDDALRLRAELPEARFVQGGTDVLVELNFGRSRPDALVDLAELAELKGWSREDGELRLGAGLTYTAAMRAARGPPARARRGVAHRRLAADPQPRHDRRQPRHRVARRGTRCRRCSSSGPRSSSRASAASRTFPLEEFLLGVKRNGARARRARERDPSAPERRRSDVHESRPAERDGDRDLLPRGRRRHGAARCGPRSARPP